MDESQITTLYFIERQFQGEQRAQFVLAGISEQHGISCMFASQRDKTPRKALAINSATWQEEKPRKASFCITIVSPSLCNRT